jgi:ribonuclease HI
MKKKFYAIRQGHKPGIYLDWDSAKAQVDGFRGAQYKGFATRGEAEDFMNGRIETPAPRAPEPAVHIPPGTIVMYTDGACSGNPGRGGYGVVILSAEGRKELSAGFRRTTNNRMEIMGCIVGLESLPDNSVVTLFSDSKYVVDTITKGWAKKWRSNRWQRRTDNGEFTPALNADLWARMLDLCDRHTVRFEWVRGHSGNTENERCDVLAVAATASDNLGIDSNYENGRLS